MQLVLHIATRNSGAASSKLAELVTTGVKARATFGSTLHALDCNHRSDWAATDLTSSDAVTPRVVIPYVDPTKRPLPLLRGLGSK